MAFSIRSSSRGWWIPGALALLLLSFTVCAASGARGETSVLQDGETGSETDPPAPEEASEDAASEDEGSNETRLSEEEAIARLRPDHRRFLDEVQALMSEEEREAFLSLSKDYQKSSFIEHFWRVRDPFPETAANELEDSWEQRLEIAKTKYEDLSDARAKAMMIYGEPVDTQEVRCSTVLKPLEVWSYSGNMFIRGRFTLVLVREGARDHYRLWSPVEGLFPLVSPTMRIGTDETVLVQQIANECFRGDQLLLALESALAWTEMENPIPQPSSEWLQTFVSTSTDLPEGADSFPATLGIRFPGRHQSRTVVQGVIEVDVADIQPSTLEGAATYNLLLDGEIVRNDDLFESFRYRFQFPSGTSTRKVPILFERNLRPGEYKLVIRARDLSSGRYYREERDLHVPMVHPRRAQTAGPAAGREPVQASAATSLAGAAADPTAGDEDGETGERQLSATLLAEANATLSSGDWSVRLLPPPPGLTVGNVRVEARVKGEGIGRVRFLLNDRQVMSKRNPPYSVEIQLGDAPRLHRVAAVALDEDGRELARDEIQLNTGPHRFAVRLVEPRRGGTYTSSLRARAVVEVPEGEALDRLEIYLNETLLATLYQPPFVQPIVIPDSMDTAYVRAAAYLADGLSSEDVVFVNAPDFIDHVNVDFVELYTTVLDKRGRPVQELAAKDFRVLEDGNPQSIARFERVDDIPIYAGVVLDTSMSMTEELHEAVEGALQFFQTVLTPKDRAAVITFGERHELAVRFTNNIEVLAGGVAGLVAEGETYLYDSLIYALYYFSGVKGKRAIILLSDGEDVGSHYRFEDALDYARRTGVAVYTIGLGLPSSQRDIQIKLQKLAEETGGRSFFIDRAAELGGVYKKIEDELRSQYLLAYQSSNKDGDKFREVEVEMLQEGFEAKTMRGYYP